jgi:hypothetical protein
MSRCPITSSLILASLLMVVTVSCQRGPAGVKQPSINASSAGKLAMEHYDTNGDGKVAGDELENAPSLKAALPRMDTNGDNAITAAEVAARVGVWKGTGTGIMAFSFIVTLDGAPLADANVTFVPDPCLGEDVKQATCTTNMFGKGVGTIAKQDLPDPTYPGGMQLGIYTVRISKLVGGKETIPAKYNEQTILGQEVSPDVPEIGSQRVIYALSTK